MEEDNRVNSILANEKYPKEIEAYKKKLKDCEDVAGKSVMTQSELNDIKKKVIRNIYKNQKYISFNRLKIVIKIDEVNREVNQLIEKRDKNRDLSDDKLIMFRQQAIIIGRKKDQLAENLKEYRMENTGLEKQLKERRKNLGDEGEVPKGEDVFDKYLTLKHTHKLIYSDPKVQKIRDQIEK